MMFVILLMIVAVAAFNIVATLVMIVKEKQTDIAILRTLGAGPPNILATFAIQGVMIGFLAETLLGAILGTLLSHNLESLVAWLERVLGIQFLDASVYYMSDLPAYVEGMDVVRVCTVAFLLCAIATIYPAWRASRTTRPPRLCGEVSLIDVVLLLVVFFILSSRFSDEEGACGCTCRRRAPYRPRRWAASRWRDQRHANGKLPREPARAHQLKSPRRCCSAALLKEAGTNRSMRVTLRADARATHQSVITAMDVLERLGFSEGQHRDSQSEAPGRRSLERNQVRAGSMVTASPRPSGELAAGGHTSPPARVFTSSGAGASSWGCSAACCLRPPLATSFALFAKEIRRRHAFTPSMIRAPSSGVPLGR